MEGVLKGYLSRPGIHAALGCGPFSFDARRDLHVAHGQNDPGLYTRAKEFLQPHARSHRHAAVVIAPELENWIWQDSPHVCAHLGHDGSFTDLRQQLERKGFWRPGEAKPHRPKEAVEEVLRVNRIPRSSAIYRDLAGCIGTRGCTDRAFLSLRDAMRRWFPAASS